MAAKKLTLYTMPFSHFSEAARWALREARVPYIEKGYLPGCHFFASRGVDRGEFGTGLPYLADGSTVVDPDSWACVARLGEVAPELRGVLNDTVGPSARSIAYSHVLRRDFSAMDPLVESADVPLWQRLFYRAPGVKAGIFRSMHKAMVKRGRHVDLCRALVEKAARETLEPLVSDPDFATRPDGGPTARAIALAALFAPLVMPPRYAGHYYGAAACPLAYATAPVSLRHEADRWRQTSVGRWTLNFYDRHYDNAPSADDSNSEATAS